MSDLLNSASLVMIPSGYAEDKVYSVVPSDGSGDMTLTRASNGTRVNSAGLVEVCPWNDLTYSQEIQNTSVWNQLGGDLVVTGNAVISPDGTQNAGAITLANSANRYFVHTILGLTGGVPYTYSVYMKSASGNLSVNMGGVNGLAGVTKTVTTEWQRFTYTFTPATSYGEYFGFDNRGAGSSTSGTLYFWGAQLNIGSTAKPYFPTTDRLNVPRLTYQNGGGGCPSLLLEKQSTNLALYSEQFDNADWQKFGTSFTVTANNAISPDGTQNADTLNIANNNNILYQSKSGTFAGNTYTFSIYAKGSGTFVMNVRLNGTTTTTQTKTLSSTWQRFDVTVTNAIAVIAIDTYLELNTSSTMAVWGAQLEASSYPTSYIPTTSSSATRVADACYKKGISSLIGQTEGTALLDFQFNGVNDAIILDIAASGLSPQNRIILYQPNSTAVQFIVLYNDTNPVSIASSSYAVGQRLKVAIAYKENDFAFYINGVQIGIDSSGSVPATSRIDIGNRQDGAYPASITVNEFYLSKTRLTNAQLASITSL